MKVVYKSLYPSIMSEFNIAPNTQIGRIEINSKVYNNENTYKIPEEKYSRGGEFIDKWNHLWQYSITLSVTIFSINSPPLEYFSSGIL